MLSPLSFYKRDCENIISHASLKIMAYFKLVVQVQLVICRGFWLMKKDPYGFCYGSCTREFLNMPSVKVNGKHGNTVSKVFPLYCLTETTVLTFLQGRGEADLQRIRLISKEIHIPSIPYSRWYFISWNIRRNKN